MTMINTIDETEDKIIYVRKKWNDKKHVGWVRMSQIRIPGWEVTLGKAVDPAPHFFIRGHVKSNEINGNIYDNINSGDIPDNASIVIVKKDNDPAVYKELLKITGPKPSRTAEEIALTLAARKMVKALAKRGTHPAIEFTNTKKHGEVYLIRPVRIPGLADPLSKSKTKRRIARVRSLIGVMMKMYPQYQELSYRNMLAYKL